MKTIKKIFKLALLFTISSLAFQVKAQFSIAATNNTMCTWVVTVYDASSTILGSYTIIPGPTSYPATCVTGVASYVIVSESSNNCNSTTFNAPFNYTSISTFPPSTCNGNCNSNNNTCQGNTDSCPGGVFLFLQMN